MAASLNCPDVLKRYQTKQKNELEAAKSPKPTPKSAKATPSKAGRKLITPAAKKASPPAKKTKAATKAKPKAKPATKAAKKQTVEEQDWEVEKIIDIQYNEDGTKNYLIRWKGCDASQDTWEPEDNVDSPELVEAFMSKTDSDEAPKKKGRKG